MGHVYQRWWRICPEINVFPTFECHMFYLLYPFVTYLLTLRRTYGKNLCWKSLCAYSLLFGRIFCVKTTIGFNCEQKIVDNDILIGLFWK
jgi:hypothetical protein